MQKLFVGLIVALATAGCGDGEPASSPATASWSVVGRAEGAALLGVHGTGPNDVWVSGGDDGKGPVVLHYDGRRWERRDTGMRGDLWWVHAVEGGPVFFGGSGATLLRYEDGQFERVHTPGLGRYTVYGVWAAAPDDVYLVGSVAARNGFVWHYDGEKFVDVPLPDSLPLDEYRDTPGLFKVSGESPADVLGRGSARGRAAGQRSRRLRARGIGHRRDALHGALRRRQGGDCRR